MSRYVLAIVLLLQGLGECFAQGRQPTCTNGKPGPVTITPRDPGGGLDPKYGFYCGRGHRCQSGKPDCDACDVVDEGCKAHDVCWTQGACAAPNACDFDLLSRLSTRETFYQTLTPAEQSQLAQMRACNVALCNDMHRIHSVTADSNEGRLMAQTTFGCNPRLVPVMGGRWRQANGTLVDIRQTGNRVEGNYQGAGAHAKLTGTIKGTFDGAKFVGEYTNREGSVAGTGSLELTFSTDYKTGSTQTRAQDKLEGTWRSRTFANQQGAWLMTRD